VRFGVLRSEAQCEIPVSARADLRSARGDPTSIPLQPKQIHRFGIQRGKCILFVRTATRGRNREQAARRKKGPRDWMSQLLTIIVLLESAALALLWLLRAPDRTLDVLMFLALVPIGLGAAFGQVLPAAYLIVPAATLLFLIDRARQTRAIGGSTGRSSVLSLLVLVFLAVVFANFFRRPILPADVAAVGRRPAGIHAWMGFGLSACYFIVFSSVAIRYPDRTERMLRFTARLCLVLCAVGFILVHSHGAQDLFAGLRRAGLFTDYFFSTGGSEILETRFRQTGGGYQIGTLGLAASIALIYALGARLRTTAKVAVVMFCLAAILQGGQRAHFVGVIVAILVWSFAVRNLRMSLVISLALACGLVYVIGVTEQLPAFFRRTMSLFTLGSEAPLPRLTLFPMYLESLVEHPWFGVGIGVTGSAGTEGSFAEFLAQKLRTGGHGAYISLLYLFGLSAFIPFVLILAGSLRSSYRMFRRAASPGIRSTALFCFLFLVYYMFPLVVEGNGGDPLLFGIVGIVAGLSVRAGRAPVHGEAGRIPAPTLVDPLAGARSGGMQAGSA